MREQQQQKHGPLFGKLYLRSINVYTFSMANTSHINLQVFMVPSHTASRTFSNKLMKNMCHPVCERRNKSLSLDTYVRPTTLPFP